jgi:predicted lipoprotein with Yx(FWY)xxD motif
VNPVSRSVIPLTAMLAVFSLATACTSGTAGPNGTPGAAPAAGAAQIPGMPDPKAEAAPGVTAAALFDLGPIVVDTNGFTLYRFDRDTVNPPKSNCSETCARTWVPAKAEGDLVVAGIDRALVGTVTRDDGTEQVTLAGWPLYRNANDAMPGDTIGQGVDKAWFPVKPDGTKVVLTADTWQADDLGI